MSDPTNTDGATVNTDGATANTDAQTTSGPAGGDDAAGDFEYPDGSKPPIDPETGLPILEDRSADFPDEAEVAIEYAAMPVIETRDGQSHILGSGSGMSGYRGLAAKRAEKALPEQSPETSQEAPTGSGATDDTSGIENGPETGTQGSGDDSIATSETVEVVDGDDTGAAPDAGEDVGAGDDSAEDAGDDSSEPEAPADEGYDPSAHTVDEVQAYLADNADQATYVLDRERDGKARKTLIGA